MPKVNWVKLVIAAVLMVIVGMVINNISAMMDMRHYMNPAYCQVWSKIMMPNAGPPPIEFFCWSLGLSFIAALLFGWVYNVLKAAVPGSGVLIKGFWYGVLVFLVGSLPGMFSLYLLINLPRSLIASWTISGFVIAVVDGCIVAWLIK